MKADKPLQFGLTSLFGLTALAAFGTWVVPKLPPLDWNIAVPAGMVVYPFLILLAIDWIVERAWRRKR